jgi:hypothetical protein
MLTLAGGNRRTHAAFMKERDPGKSLEAVRPVRITEAGPGSMAAWSLTVAAAAAAAADCLGREALRRGLGLGSGATSRLTKVLVMEAKRKAGKRPYLSKQTTENN